MYVRAASRSARLSSHDAAWKYRTGSWSSAGSRSLVQLPQCVQEASGIASYFHVASRMFCSIKGKDIDVMRRDQLTHLQMLLLYFLNICLPKRLLMNLLRSTELTEITQNTLRSLQFLLRSLFITPFSLSLSLYLTFSLHRTVDIFIAAPLLKAINQHLVSGFSDAVKGSEQVNTREYFRLDL